MHSLVCRSVTEFEVWCLDNPDTAGVVSYDTLNKLYDDPTAHELLEDDNSRMRLR